MTSLISRKTWQQLGWRCLRIFLSDHSVCSCLSVAERSCLFFFKNHFSFVRFFHHITSETVDLHANYIRENGNYFWNRCSSILNRSKRFSRCCFSNQSYINNISYSHLIQLHPWNFKISLNILVTKYVSKFNFDELFRYQVPIDFLWFKDISLNSCYLLRVRTKKKFLAFLNDYITQLFRSANNIQIFMLSFSIELSFSKIYRMLPSEQISCFNVPLILLSTREKS